MTIQLLKDACIGTAQGGVPRSLESLTPNASFLHKITLQIRVKLTLHKVTNSAN